MTALLLLLLAGPSPLQEKDAVDASVKRVLGGETYGFCHDGNYPLFDDEYNWCPLVGGVSSRCPQLPAACKHEPVAMWGGRRSHGGWGASGGSHIGKAGSGAKRTEEEDEPRYVRLPALGGLGQVLLWVLLLGAVGAVVYAIAKNFRGFGKQEEEAPQPSSPAEVAAAAAAGGGPVETDVERLLNRARAAATRGDYKRAIDDAYAALLRRLDGDGLIRIHPARTNGDYVRDLRERPELRAPVKDVVRDVERVQFGASEPTNDLFQSVLGRVLPLCGKTLAALVLFATFSCQGGTHSRGPSDHSPSGIAGVLEVLTQSGLTPKHRVAPIEKLGEGDEAIVLLPGAELDPKQWRHVLHWVEGGGSVVVANAEKSLPDGIGARLVEQDAPTEQAKVGAAFTMPDIQVAIPERHRLEVGGSNVQVMLDRGGAPYAAWIAHGRGTVVVLADSYLFTNASLVVADNAAFVVQMLAMLSEKPQLVDATTGGGAPSPVASVTRGRLAPLLGQLLFALLIFFLFKGVAFGTLRDPPAASRRAFVDHARALGLQYAKARAKRHAFSMYAGYALDRLRERVQLGGRRGLSGLAEAVAAKTGRSETDVMRLLVEAQSARDVMASAGVVSQEDLSLLRELATLLRETGGSR